MTGVEDVLVKESPPDTSCPGGDTNTVMAGGALAASNFICG